MREGHIHRVSVSRVLLALKLQSLSSFTESSSFLSLPHSLSLSFCLFALFGLRQSKLSTGTLSFSSFLCPCYRHRFHRELLGSGDYRCIQGIFAFGRMYTSRSGSRTQRATLDGLSYLQRRRNYQLHNDSGSSKACNSTDGRNG